MTTVNSFAGTRDNNLNLLRFVAASLVVVAHSFVLSLGTGAKDPLESHLGVSLGTLGVYIFFVVSGYLITMSFCLRNALAVFVWARVLRILPALVICVLLTTFVLGPVFTQYTAAQYFSQGGTYGYLAHNTVLLPWRFEETLPRVFLHNPFPQTVNGSLWTLPVELRMYLLVAALGVAGLLRWRRSLGLLIAVLLLAFVVALEAFSLHAATYKLAMFFMAGVLMYLNSDLVPLNAIALIVLALLVGLSFGTKLFGFAASLLLIYSIFWLAYVPSGWIRKFNNFGDYSYGMYIYAFPIQQAAVALGFGTSPVKLFWISFPATLACAIASWHLIEKPALAWKTAWSFTRESALLPGSHEDSVGAPRPETPANALWAFWRQP